MLYSNKYKCYQESAFTHIGNSYSLNCIVQWLVQNKNKSLGWALTKKNFNKKKQKFNKFKIILKSCLSPKFWASQIGEEDAIISIYHGPKVQVRKPQVCRNKKI